ncbi:hypothetical protein [Clostridium sp. DL1XJH146]
MDFLAEQQLFYTSKKYETIYKYLNENLGIKYHELFTLVASIGFVNDRQIKFEKRGREFRSNYLNNQQKASIYSIILNDPELGKQIEMFNDKNFNLQCRKKLEEYAEGGMEILVEEVFKNKWNGTSLDSDYDEYDVDIMSYFLEYTMKVPF